MASSSICDIYQSILRSPKTEQEIIKEFQIARIPLDNNYEMILNDSVAQKILQRKHLETTNSTLYILNPQTPRLPIESGGTHSKTCQSVAGSMSKQLTSEVESLKLKLSEAERNIKSLGDSYSEDELQDHIQKLHDYNEIKDIGQILLGKIAEFEGVTTSSLYERFDLSLND